MNIKVRSRTETHHKMSLDSHYQGGKIRKQMQKVRNMLKKCCMNGDPQLKPRLIKLLIRLIILEKII